MASRGFLILDPLLWESPIKSRAQNVTELEVGPDQPRVSRTAWLEIFSLTVAYMGAELAVLPLPAHFLACLVPVPPSDSRGALSRHCRSPGSVESMAVGLL